MPKRALFVVNDLPEAGLGHVVRCGALAAELRLRGWATETRGAKESSPGVDYWAGREMPDATIVDVQWSGPRFEVSHPESRCHVLIVDAPRDATNVDLLVCGCAGATPEMFADSGARKVLAGPEYALLRPEFRAVSWGQYGFSSSHDVYDLRTASRESAESLARIIAASRVVITAGGMRSLEAACVGAPMVIVQQSADQKLNCKGLVRAGMSLLLEGQAEATAENMLVWGGSPASKSSELSAAGRALVDGRGCIRVSDEIERLVS